MQCTLVCQTLAFVGPIAQSLNSVSGWTVGSESALLVSTCMNTLPSCQVLKAETIFWLTTNLTTEASLSCCWQLTRKIIQITPYSKTTTFYGQYTGQLVSCVSQHIQVSLRMPLLRATSTLLLLCLKVTKHQKKTRKAVEPHLVES